MLRKTKFSLKQFLGPCRSLLITRYGTQAVNGRRCSELKFIGTFFSKACKTTTMKKNIVFLLFSSLMITGFISCKKSDNADEATLQIRMKDAPTALEQVNIDIQSVMVKYRDDVNDSTLNWVTLNTQAGIYNLLLLQNGVDTLLASGVIPQRQIKEIRLILGSNNTVKDNGTVYPLTIPSGSESGLKIKFSKKLDQSLNILLIDFDAAMSVSQNGSGNYMLKPVIRIQ